MRKQDEQADKQETAEPTKGKRFKESVQVLRQKEKSLSTT